MTLLCSVSMVFVTMPMLVMMVPFITTDFKLSLMPCKANSRDGLTASGRRIPNLIVIELNYFSDHEVEAAKNALLVKLESALSDPVARADDLAVQVRLPDSSNSSIIMNFRLHKQVLSMIHLPLPEHWPRLMPNT